MLELKNQDVVKVVLKAKAETVLNGKPEYSAIMASFETLVLSDVKADACGKVAETYLKFYRKFKISHADEKAEVVIDIKRVVMGKAGNTEVCRWYQDKIVIADVDYLATKAETALKLAAILDKFNAVESGITETVRSNLPGNTRQASVKNVAEIDDALIAAL